MKGWTMTVMAAIAVLFADAGDVGHMSGVGWSMMGVGWLAMAAIVGSIVWAVIRTTPTSQIPSHDATASARRILADRFAKGEIDRDEYNRRSDRLDRP